MSLFSKRPLALMISISIILSSLFALLPDFLRIPLMLAVLAATPLAIKLSERSGMGMVCGLSRVSFIVISSALTLSLMLTSFAYYNVYAARYESLEYNTIRATVIEVRRETPYDAVYTIRLTSLNGEQLGGNGLMSAEGSLSLAIGDVIEADVEFCPLDEFYEYYDSSRLDMLSKGYVFTCKASGDVFYMGRTNGIRIQLERFRDFLSSKFTLFLSSDSAAFADAILLGKRDGLGRIYRDFRYAGVVHILALSGMHLSIICGGLDKLLALLHIRERPRHVITTLWLIFYIALTGFLLSVLRAALMLIIKYVNGLIHTDADNVTSLFAAVFLIALTDPSAIFDVSLQLSFAATLGVLLLSEAAAKINNSSGDNTSSPSPLKALMSKLKGGMIASLGATLFVLPLQWAYFGEISLMSIPASLILTFICNAILSVLPLYLIACLLGSGFVGARLGYIVDLLVKTAGELAAVFADALPMVSLRYPFTLPIIILMSAAIIWMMAKKVRSWLYSLIPFAAAAAVFALCVLAYDSSAANTANITYKGIHSGGGILAVSKGEALLIDVSDGSSDISYDSEMLLAENYLTEIDTFMLTRTARRHTGEIRKLLAMRKVERLLIPMPKDDYEKYIIDDIKKIARDYGTEVTLYDPFSEFEMQFGIIDLGFPERTVIKRSVKPLTVINFSVGGNKLTYIGSSAWESEYVWQYAKDAEYLIFGTNGPKIKTSPSGSVGENTKFVCITSDELAKGLSPWLTDYNGILFTKPTIRVIME